MAVLKWPVFRRASAAGGPENEFSAAYHVALDIAARGAYYGRQCSNEASPMMAPV
jgi:hypothetical protein